MSWSICYELFGGIAHKNHAFSIFHMLRVCNGFLCSMSVTYDGAVLQWQW